MLIIKGFWYIIFALIFGVGVSYSQGMNAKANYKLLMSLKGPEQASDFEKDLSYTRRRSKIVNYVMGTKAKVMATIIAVLLATLIIDPTQARWRMMILYLGSIIVVYALTYFYLLYWICYPIYKDKVQGEGE